MKILLEGETKFDLSPYNYHAMELKLNPLQMHMKYAEELVSPDCVYSSYEYELTVLGAI